MEETNETKNKEKEKLDLEFREKLQNVLEEKFKEARMIGVNIGFQAAMIQIYNSTENMKTAREIKAYIRKEINNIRKRTGDTPLSFDKNGKIIVENDD